MTGPTFVDEIDDVLEAQVVDVLAVDLQEYLAL